MQQVVMGGSSNGVRKSKSMSSIFDHCKIPEFNRDGVSTGASMIVTIGKGARERFGECNLVVPYVELGVGTDDMEFFTSRKQHGAERLPPPCRFVDSRKASEQPEPERERTSPKAIVSLHQPHKILTVSKELCTLLGYAPEELCGRTIKIFQGPRTDTSFFHSAIKNAALLCGATQRTFIYGSDGREHEVCAGVVISSLIDSMELQHHLSFAPFPLLHSSSKPPSPIPNLAVSLHPHRASGVDPHPFPPHTRPSPPPPPAAHPPAGPHGRRLSLPPLASGRCWRPASRSSTAPACWWAAA
jgi:PAS domain S-box-containing protein